MLAKKGEQGNSILIQFSICKFKKNAVPPSPPPMLRACNYNQQVIFMYLGSYLAYLQFLDSKKL